MKRLNRIKLTGRQLKSAGISALASALSFLLVWSLVATYGGGDKVASHAGHDHSGAAEETVWSCSMHPEIRMPEPGLCPICNMELIEVQEGGFSLTGSEAGASGIASVAVTRSRVERELFLSGRIEIDETSTASISARFDGRLEQLFIGTTGIDVQQGEHLYAIWSPELSAAQDAYLGAIGALGGESGTPSSDYASAKALRLQAARERLVYLGLTSRQIDRIGQRGKAEDSLTIYASASGTVIEKRLSQGDYVSRGAVIYRIADLSRLWLMLNAYEPDLQWLRYGQKALIRFDALPGQELEARIDWINPVIDPVTRTATIRISLDNSEGVLKPGMLATASIHSSLSSGNRQVDPEIAGMMICPMHPEIQSEKPGRCGICKMDLVSAESLGFTAAAEVQEHLVIPVSAPLITGRRAIVYIEKSDQGRLSYEPREVVLGPRNGSFYTVESGLQEGEKVVIRGAFKVDAARQILGEKGGMMVPEAEEIPLPFSHRSGITLPELEHFELSPARRQVLMRLSEISAGFNRALAEDDTAAAALFWAQLITAADSGLFESLDLAQKQFLGSLVRYGHSPTEIAHYRDLALLLNRYLRELYTQFPALFKKGGFSLNYCPMADENRGAWWVDNREGVFNPYYGASMLKCGETVEVPDVR